MPRIPAICETCETVFPSYFAGDGGVKMYMLGNKSGPCPNCGGWGYVADGLYQTYNNIIEITKVDNGSDIDKLIRILNSVDENTTTAELEKTIDRTIPQYKDIIDEINVHISSTDNNLMKWLSVVQAICAVLMLLQGIYHSNSDNIDEEFYKQLYIEQASEIKDNKDRINELEKQKENNNEDVNKLEGESKNLRSE